MTLSPEACRPERRGELPLWVGTGVTASVCNARLPTTQETRLSGSSWDTQPTPCPGGSDRCALTPIDHWPVTGCDARPAFAETGRDPARADGIAPDLRSRTDRHGVPPVTAPKGRPSMVITLRLLGDSRADGAASRSPRAECAPVAQPHPVAGQILGQIGQVIEVGLRIDPRVHGIRPSRQEMSMMAQEGSAADGIVVG